MKHIMTIVLAVGVVLSPVVAYAEEVVVTLKGLVCSFCAQGIKKTFSREEGVEKVDVDLDTKVATITTAKDDALSDSKIRELMTDSGYEVVEIKRR